MRYNSDVKKFLQLFCQKYKGYYCSFLIDVLFVFRLKNQIPDLERSLDMIKLLKKHKAESSGEKLVTEFLLSEQLYSKAILNPSDTVYLWLGVSNIPVEIILLVWFKFS